MKNIISRIWLIALIIVSGACSPEDGEQGLPGQDANVTISPWYDVSFSDSPAVNTHFFLETNSNNLMEVVHGNAVVLVYARATVVDEESEELVFSIPIDLLTKSYFFVVSGEDEEEEGGLLIIGRSNDGQPHVFDDFDQVRYVIIQSNNIVEQSINIESSYEELINRFDILD